MKLTKEAKKFLNENRELIEKNMNETAEEWYNERYNNYKENWEALEIEDRFSHKALIINLECDLESLN
jgi:hypothetical protein